MKIVAIDSSGLVASIAVLEDEQLIAEYTINLKKTHSQTLLPMLDEIVNRIELELSSIDAIAVAAGPGSFTGLRIGSATAKGLGLVLKKPIIAVPTVDGLAYNLYGTDKLVCPIMDARRNQVYTGIYEFAGNDNQQMTFQLKTILEQCVVQIEDVANKINELNREVIFTGDGIPVFSSILKTLMKVPYSFAPPHMNRQRAATIGALGAIYYKDGNMQTPSEHEPNYLRMSQAERERLEKEESSSANS
ncbi:MAG TPA: tRNA (adenosine(37)-N6)-threonylcarbamoyltransferase complex dimerization subunit type 1 TsaB [Lachnospiraceae bacterium]|nr:tRNA (adenosine(37)-N6)-threonylcarbamoyltransferase complex dimerization subunit type 1 TsaB [Lachnospiraceae bacterium]